MIGTRVTRLLVPGLMLLAAGCGSDKGPELAPVHGVVTYEGKPLGGATVTFVPKVVAAGQEIATAMSNANGEYELMAGERKGAAGGSHYVYITAPNPESPLVKDPRIIKRAPPTAEAIREASLIPVSYANALNSGLSAQVLLGETNVVNFNLTADGKGGLAFR